MEERLLVDLLGAVGVADEDDLDVPVAPRQEDVEQHVEALGEILHVLGHRAGDVHQAEHHRLRHRLRLVLEAAIADVDRIDEGNALHLRLQRLDLGRQFDASRLVCTSASSGLERRDRFRARPPQRDASRHRTSRTVRLIEMLAGEPDVE